MWFLWDHYLYGFLLLVTVIILFVVIKFIWIIVAVSREEANKIELKTPLSCFKSSLRLTHFMLFVTFCCSSAVASTSFHCTFLFWPLLLLLLDCLEKQRGGGKCSTARERGEKKNVGLGYHTGRIAGMNEWGGRIQKRVREKWVHMDKWESWDCVWGSKWKNEWDLSLFGPLDPGDKVNETQLKILAGSCDKKS